MNKHPDNWSEWAMSADPEMGWYKSGAMIGFKTVDTDHRSVGLEVIGFRLKFVGGPRMHGTEIRFPSPAHAIYAAETLINMLRGDEVPKKRRVNTAPIMGFSAEDIALAEIMFNGEEVPS